MQGKIIINADGIAYFGLGSFGTEGTYVTTYWRLDVPSDRVVHGESACWPDKSPYVKPDQQGTTHVTSWRVCNADGSYADAPQSIPPAFAETSEVPRPKVRPGTELRWSYHGWQKWSRKEKAWVPA
jgi:hypothetical protein